MIADCHSLLSKMIIYYPTSVNFVILTLILLHHCYSDTTVVPITFFKFLTNYSYNFVQHDSATITLHKSFPYIIWPPILYFMILTLLSHEFSLNFLTQKKEFVVTLTLFQSYMTK